MQREEEGQDVEEQVRQIVHRTVLEGVLTGWAMTEDEADGERRLAEDQQHANKRSRTDEN